MPWGRFLVGVLLSAFAVLLIVSLAIGAVPGAAAKLFSGVSTPGLSSTDSAALRAPYQNLAAGKYDEILEAAIDEIDRSTARPTFERMRGYIPKTNYTEERLLRWAVGAYPQGQFLRGVHEYKYPDRVVRSETLLLKTPAGWKMAEFNVNAISIEDADKNVLSFSGRPVSYVLFVLAVAVVPLFVVVTAWYALFWKNLKRRGLWVLFIVVGLTTFFMDGRTGEIAFQPLSFQLMSSSAIWSSSAFEPWRFGLSIPVGAIVFWVRRVLARTDRNSSESQEPQAVST